MQRPIAAISLTLAAGLLWAAPARGDDASSDPIGACDRAAARAEAAWHVPSGLLASIGTVESGRGDLGRTWRIAWPWTINAAGRGLYLSNKAVAVATVRALQSAGVRVIDVGCFQVDLFYHPDAFASLEDAFDPDSNAGAAARILTEARFGGASWARAVALYHSASPLRGERYLQQVQVVWPSVRTRIANGLADRLAEYAVLLSPEARLVRVITAADPAPAVPDGLPRVVGPEGSGAVLQWVGMPGELPALLAPEPTPRRPRRALN